jgi:hypothetical protein
MDFAQSLEQGSAARPLVGLMDAKLCWLKLYCPVTTAHSATRVRQARAGARNSRRRHARLRIFAGKTSFAVLHLLPSLLAALRRPVTARRLHRTHDICEPASALKSVASLPRL